MVNWEEKYLRLAAETDELRKKNKLMEDHGEKVLQDLKLKLQNQRRAADAWRTRVIESADEIKSLYKNSWGLKVEGFIVTMWRWARGGFKLAPKEMAEKRLAKCKSCPHFTEKNRCTLCGCFMLGKTKVPQASCPIGKWKAETENPTE